MVKIEGMGQFMLEIQKVKQRLPKSLFIVCLAFIVVMFLFYGYFSSYKSAPANALKATNDVYIRVVEGMNAEKIANNLYQKGVIDSVLKFRLLAKVNGLDSSLKAGSYTFNSAMSYEEIIRILVEGKTSAFNITIPEGYTIDQISKLLEEKGIAKSDEVQEISKNYAPYDYITGAPNVKYRVEGFLFPDTYEIANNQKAQDVLKMMSKQFDEQFNEEMRTRAADMGLSIRNVIILASLVEKEAQDDKDRPIIAQVFINRLRAFMPLQSCATIQYILGQPKAELSVQDTKIESPYNTYQNMGLPPGPIANPGIASIKAVLYSEPTEYLYFVADKDGKHHFSKTYEEHLQAIDRIS